VTWIFGRLIGAPSSPVLAVGEVGDRGGFGGHKGAGPFGVDTTPSR